jgi:hypothetical protein
MTLTLTRVAEPLLRFNTHGDGRRFVNAAITTGIFGQGVFVVMIHVEAKIVLVREIRAFFFVVVIMEAILIVIVVLVGRHDGVLTRRDVMKR